jgi:hypothetical protein
MKYADAWIALKAYVEAEVALCDAVFEPSRVYGVLEFMNELEETYE